MKIESVVLNQGLPFIPKGTEGFIICRVENPKVPNTWRFANKDNGMIQDYNEDQIIELGSSWFDINFLVTPPFQKSHWEVGLEESIINEDKFIVCSPPDSLGLLRKDWEYNKHLVAAAPLMYRFITRCCDIDSVVMGQSEVNKLRKDAELIRNKIWEM